MSDRTKKILVAAFSLNMILLRCLSGQSQTNIPEYIKERFQTYCNSVIREEIFIHTDKEEYISGEDMWFNIYLMDRKSSGIAASSKIVYVEILNYDNKPVIQKRFMLDSGTGPGHIVLPDSLSSGTYTIRAYTSWMKNFLPFDCYIKEINIYNAFNNTVFKRSAWLIEEIEGKTNIQTDSGLTLAVNNRNQDSLEIILKTDEEFRTKNKNQIFLFIQTHGIINYLGTEEILSENTRIAVSKKLLMPGINQITLFDLDGPVCDKFIYTPINEENRISIHSVNSYKKRDQVNIGIEPGTNTQEPDIKHISVSVSPITDSDHLAYINEYFIFGTEFGFSPQKLLKEKRISELPPEIMDSLLLTLRSNWIIWDSIFSNNTPLFKYPAEKEYQYICGKLLTDKLKPVREGETLILSVPGREAVFQYTTTDMKGDFNFRVDICNQLKEFIIQPDLASNNRKVFIEPPFASQYIPLKVYDDSLKTKIPPGASTQITNFRIKKNYALVSAGETAEQNVSSVKQKRFYGKPDFELKLEDYVALDSMQEVFFELIPRVSMTLKNSEYEISVTDPLRNKLEGSPVVMFDGVVIRDLSSIVKLNPALIEKIDVVWDKYRVGEYIFNGIINIISKSADFSLGSLSENAIRVNNMLIDPVNLFVSPDYSTTEMKRSRSADTRNTLYWNPFIMPEKNGISNIKFCTADIKSEYLIQVYGINSDGKLFSVRANFKVE
jgi:hypothetical protein